MNNVELVRTDDLIPYEKNNRKHPQDQIDAIARNIRLNGFLNPILIDEKNNIIAGHGRLKAINQLRVEEGDSMEVHNGELLELTSIKAIRLKNLSKAQIDAYRIWDNQSAQLGEWDWENLSLEFDELKLSGMESFTGFEDKDFDFLTPKEDKPKVKEKDVKRLKHLAQCPACGHEFKLAKEED